MATDDTKEPQQLSAECLCRLFSTGPPWELRGNLGAVLRRWPGIPKLQELRDSSTALLLPGLPNELALMILPHADYKTMCALLQTSLALRSQIMGSEWFERVMKYAGSALVALKATGLIQRHSLSAIDAVLQTDRCASCGKTGELLSVLTLRRCCSECLYSVPATWLVPTSTLMKSFKLSEDQISGLPILSSIRGKYYVRKDIAEVPDGDRFVSAHDAKWLVQEIDRDAKGLSLREWLETFYVDTGTECQRGNFMLEDLYGSLAAIELPALQGGEVSSPLYCQICNLECGGKVSACGYGKPETASAHFPRLRAYSRTEFLEHVQKDRHEFLDFVKEYHLEFWKQIYGNPCEFWEHIQENGRIAAIYFEEFEVFKKDEESRFFDGSHTYMQK